MTQEMGKLRDSGTKVERRKARRKQKQKQDAKAPLGKAFADLSEDEKDDLLKRLAIMAGLVEE